MALNVFGSILKGAIILKNLAGSDYRLLLLSIRFAAVGGFGDKKPFFCLVSLSFSPNIPDFDCKICLTS